MDSDGVTFLLNLLELKKSDALKLNSVQLKLVNNNVAITTLILLTMVTIAVRRSQIWTTANKM